MTFDSVSSCPWWIIAICVLSLTACKDTEETNHGGGDHYEACVTDWTASYGMRFNTGETFFLPVLSQDDGCDNLKWVLDDAEDADAVYFGDSFYRFTPQKTGEYVFSLLDGDTATGITTTLSVVDALSRPFHNYNYFPTHNVAAVVGTELWIAGVYSPEVARIEMATGEALEPILVGQWPTSLAYLPTENLVLVANKGSDTLGLLDVATGKQSDAIWVGDEPTNILWDEARSLAYVTLAGGDGLAVVDVPNRTLIKTIAAVFDPLALALSPDGTTLFVASHRSGQSNIFPYDEREVETEEDVAIIDLETMEVTGHILEVSSTIQAMGFDKDGQLWVSATTNNVEGFLNLPESKSFVHEMFVLETESGVAVKTNAVDFSRQDSSGGSTAQTHGFAWCDDSTWLVAEGANQALELDENLAEIRRVEVLGRPRAVVCEDNVAWVVSSNRMEVTRIDGTETETVPLGLTERRDEAEIAGLELFAGQGDEEGDNRSCNSCHADGLSDGIVWNAGPVPNRQLTRPFRWLEGTDLIGWDGYVGSVKVTGYVGGSTINHRGNTDEAKKLGAYLASIMPSPPANQHTHRDGSLSAKALEGKALFEGKAGCVGCHSGPKTTNQQVLEQGLTEGKTDIPSLVDVAKVGSWYKTGIMPTLHDTVADTAIKFGVDLSGDEIDLITQYLHELTGRDFFVLKETLGIGADHFPVDGKMTLTFSYPVLNTEENLERIQLVDGEGNPVPASLSVDNRHVHIEPDDLLSFEQDYTLNVAEEFMADDGRALLANASFALTTAKASSFSLDGSYTLTVGIPMLNFLAGTFDMDNIVEQTMTFEATPTANGANVAIDYGGDMVFDDLIVIDGDTLRTNHLPIATGPSFLNGTPITVDGLDEDGDGVMDRAEGTFKLTGPAVDLDDIAFSIEKAAAAGTCNPGSEGDHAPVITQEGDEFIIDWGEAGTLGLYVTTPDAILPLGPGNVEGGETFWVVAAASFPVAFNGPVTYGVVPENAVDNSDANGGTAGGAPLESGSCVRFSVVVDFQYSHTIMVWP